MMTSGHQGLPMPMPMAPPLYDVPPPVLEFQQQVRNDLVTCPTLTEEQVVEAVENYVAGRCCYSDKFVKEMKIKDLLATPIYIYDLEMFVETRTKDWVTEPYRGEYMPQENSFGVPIDFWAVPIQPPVRFGTSKQTHVVPGSTSVVNCAQCTGIGNVQCGICAGSMSTTCSACSGSGTNQVEQPDGSLRNIKCIKCKGMRRTSCDNCKGKGTAPCNSCKGFRRVKNYEKMDISWTTILQQMMHKEGGQVAIMQSKLDNLSKKTVAESCSQQPQDLLPFTMFRPYLDERYGGQCALPHQRVIEIRQRVHLVPGTEVVTNFKSRDQRFLVYGVERFVLFPRGYPSSCVIL